MKVTCLGHAGLKVETARATLLCDPWFSPEGAFQAGWFQYPDNSHLLATDVFNPTALVISHEHLDHVDPWFLAQVPAHIPAIIHRYPSPLLRRKILAGGNRPIIEVAPWERVEVVEGTSVFFVPEASPMNHDTAIIVQGDGHTLLNLNDARLFPQQLRAVRAEVGGVIDLLTCQGAGASWYPICYEYSPERNADVSRRKRQAKFGYLARAIRVVEPVAALPFAGPPCFLDPALFRHNAEIERGLFADQQQAADWLAQRGINNTVVLLPGDGWDMDARVRDCDPAWQGFSFSDRWPYLEAYAERRLPHVRAALARYPEPSESLWDAFRGHFEPLLTVNPYFTRKIAMRVGFDITGAGGGQWAVDWRPGREGVYPEMGDVSFRYRLESRWADPLLAGSLPWEDFFLSLRFEAWRDPDLYNDHLLGLMKLARREALEAVEQYETSMASDERITIHAEGREYRVPRFCPHAGNDLLETGEILPGGILRCLAHHYEFSLDTGECLNSVCAPLETELLQ